MGDMANTTGELLSATRKIKLTQATISPTSILVSWVIPEGLLSIDGLLVAISEKPFDNSMSPSNGQRYLASTNILAPNNFIGTAQVVYAGHKVKGDILPLSGAVTVTNIDPTKTYYVFAFGVSNTLQYSLTPLITYLLEENSGSFSGSSYPGSLAQSYTPPLNPYLGQSYYNPSTNSVYMWNGAVWILSPNSTIKTGVVDDIPQMPNQGDFFYNLTDRSLLIFDGSTWKRADTQEQGQNMVEKMGVGTDGSSDERANLIEILKVQVGYPAVCVEIGEAGFNVAINNALDEFRRRADNAYANRYVIYELQPGQSFYYLNDPRNGSNRIVDILKIHRVNLMGLGSITGDATVYAQLFYNQLYQTGAFDILSIHLMASLAEEHERIFAGNMTFLWDESSRQLQILRKASRKEKVLLEVSMERTEQELLTDRWAKQWLQHWAHSELLEQMGIIRTKFGTLPGAGGGISLNGSELLALSAEMQTEALRQLQDFEVGNGGSAFQNCAFLCG